MNEGNVQAKKEDVFVRNLKRTHSFLLFLVFISLKSQIGK